MLKALVMGLLFFLCSTSCMTSIDVSGPDLQKFQIINEAKGEAVTLGSENITLTTLTGQKLQLRALNQSLNTTGVQWQVTDPEIGMVNDQGEFVAKKEGVTQVTIEVNGQKFTVTILVNDLSPAEVAAGLLSRAAPPGTRQQGKTDETFTLPPSSSAGGAKSKLTPFLAPGTTQPQVDESFTPITAPVLATVPALKPKIINKTKFVNSPDPFLDVPTFSPELSQTGGSGVSSSLGGDDGFLAQLFLPRQDSTHVMGAHVPINMRVLSVPPEVKAANSTNEFIFIIKDEFGAEMERINTTGLSISTKWISGNIAGRYQIFFQAKGVPDTVFNEKLVDFNLATVNSNGPPQPNRPPEINTLIYDPSPPLANLPVQLILTINEPDGDPLAFAWSASDGILSNPFIQNPVWLAPNSSGSVGISVIVSDGSLSATKSISVSVSDSKDNLTGTVFAIF